MMKNQKSNQFYMDIFNGKYPSAYLSKQINYFQNVKKELEAKKAKVASIDYRKKLLEQQERDNYSSEVDRLRGDLSKITNRFPMGTRERLEKRIEQISNLKYNAF